MSKEISITQQFKLQMKGEQVQQTLSEFMDSTLLKWFTAVTIQAVQEKPELLDADRTSLFLACQSAAKDKLMPDGREGALVVYGRTVSWQPMILGIRKRLAQAGFDIRAEIVYANDEFRYELGDNPEIVHRPAVFGDRGNIIGAYAIATELETGNKWRETMDLDELEKVRMSSRARDSSIWTTWRTEMYRKTVAKRLRKYLPISDDSLLDLIDRDNEQFDLRTTPARSTAAQKVQDAVRAAGTEPTQPEPIEGVLVEEEKPKPKRKYTRKAKKATIEVEPEQPTPQQKDDPFAV